MEKSSETEKYAHQRTSKRERRNCHLRIVPRRMQQLHKFGPVPIFRHCLSLSPPLLPPFPRSLFPLPGLGIIAQTTEKEEEEVAAHSVAIEFPGLHRRLQRKEKSM